MGSYPQICDLLEEFLDVENTPERWITVEEIRRYHHLKRSSSHAIAGILRRLYKNPTFGYSYRVIRIEKITETRPQYGVVTRYLIQKRLSPSRPGSRPEPGTILIPCQ